MSFYACSFPAHDTFFPAAGASDSSDPHCEGGLKRIRSLREWKSLGANGVNYQVIGADADGACNSWDFGLLGLRSFGGHALMRGVLSRISQSASKVSFLWLAMLQAGLFVHRVQDYSVCNIGENSAGQGSVFVVGFKLFTILCTIYTPRPYSNWSYSLCAKLGTCLLIFLCLLTFLILLNYRRGKRHKKFTRKQHPEEDPGALL